VTSIAPDLFFVTVVRRRLRTCASATVAAAHRAPINDLDCTLNASRALSIERAKTAPERPPRTTESPTASIARITRQLSHEKRKPLCVCRNSNTGLGFTNPSMEGVAGKATEAAWQDGPAARGRLFLRRWEILFRRSLSAVRATLSTPIIAASSNRD
jgi:hypothetical protein